MEQPGGVPFAALGQIGLSLLEFRRPQHKSGNRAEIHLCCGCGFDLDDLEISGLSFQGGTRIHRNLARQE